MRCHLPPRKRAADAGRFRHLVQQFRKVGLPGHRVYAGSADSNGSSNPGVLHILEREGAPIRIVGFPRSGRGGNTGSAGRMEHAAPLRHVGVFPIAVTFECLIFGRSAIRVSVHGHRRFEPYRRRLQRSKDADILYDERKPGKTNSDSVRKRKASRAADRSDEPVQSLQPPLRGPERQFAQLRVFHGFLTPAFRRAHPNSQEVIATKRHKSLKSFCAFCAFCG